MTVKAKQVKYAIALPKKENIEALISKGIDKNISVETMEKLLAMRKELKAEYAKEEFNRAMAGLQAECPVIQKKTPGGKTKSGIVAYMYATLDEIVDQVKGLIFKYGFSYSSNTKTESGTIKVTVTVKHMAGHSESSEMEVPSGGGTDIMSAPQKVAAAMTFAKRYAFCNAFGILTGDMDNDANLGKDNGVEFEKLKSIVKKLSEKELAEYREKMSKSEKYSKEQKDEFSKMVDERIAEIKSIKAKEKKDAHA